MNYSLFKELRGKGYHERLMCFNLWILEEMRNKQDLSHLTGVFKKYEYEVYLKYTGMLRELKL